MKFNGYLAPDNITGKISYAPIFAHLAWQCASTFRKTDYSGGCNGARVRFLPQSEWRMNWYTKNILQVLEPVKKKFGAALSWADLIVLAGNTAIESAGGKPMKFCGGRSDALDANGTEHLGPRQYSTPLIQVLDNFKVMGLTPREGVALSARLRSPIHMKRLGYTGSWSADPFKLSNEYFKALVNENWQLMVKPARGQAEFKAAGKQLYMLPTDIALKQDAQLLTIVREFAASNHAFLQSFAAAWTKMMNADRFMGPAGSVCT